MSKSHKKKIRYGIIALSVLVVYFLSLGPALNLARREILPEKSVWFFYKPLAIFEEWRPFETYLRWWVLTKKDRDWIKAEETWTSDQWTQHAMAELRKRSAPSTELSQSPSRKEWVDIDSRYLLFTNGWAAFASHSSHDSQRIGDIGLLRSSDGEFYTNDYHYHGGVSEYRGAEQIQPKDAAHFFELYGDKHRWKKKP